MRKNVSTSRMMHTCYRWMRPCRATRAGTQAPPLPTSIKPFCHATFSCFSAAASPSPVTLGHGATREMVGAVPACPPERPRSGVSIHKGHVPHPQRSRFHAQKCLCIAHDAHPLPMDAPLQGDTGGHTGTAPTNLHQTPLPRNLFAFCPSASTSPATLGHGAT